MKYLLVKMALRNLSRQRKRTLITGCGIAAGTCFTFLLYGFVQFSYWGLSERFSRSGNGHLQIANNYWFDSATPENSRVSKADLMKVAKHLTEDKIVGPKIHALSLRRKVSGIVSTGERSDIFVGYGVDPEGYTKMASLVSVVAGEGLDGERPNAILLGKTLADRIGARPGDNISLLVTTDKGRTNAMDATLAGLTVSDSKQWDAVSLLMPVETALTLYETDQVDALAVGLRKTDDTKSASSAVAMALGNSSTLGVRTWDQIAEFYRSVRALYGRIFLFVQSMLFALTILAVTNTLIITLHERMSEIAMLRAVGMQRSQIEILFVQEGVALGLGAGLAGLIAAWAVALLVQSTGGLPMPPPPGSSDGYSLEFLLDMTGAMEILAVTALSTLLASWCSVRRLAKANIATALSHGLSVLVAIITMGAAAPAKATCKRINEKPAEILTHVDDLRQIPKGDFILETSFTPNAGESVTYKVAGKGERFIAVAVSDAAGSRMFILSSKLGMWMQKEGMRKPLRISPSQRLIGQASNSDVVSVRFSDDYTATSFVKSILTLTPRTEDSQAAYSKIELLFEKDCLAPSGGRFYSSSGKLLKTTEYEYEIYQGRKIIKGARIADAIRTSAHTHVTFGDSHAVVLPKSLFNPENLGAAAQQILNR